MSIRIYTDGSSRGNPGPGGWGAIVSTDESVIELGGREDHTTNNRMELMAAIMALEYVRAQNLGAEPIEVYSDSKYVIMGITEWIIGWQSKGWKTAAKKAVINQDLWERLLAATLEEPIAWKYVEGHAGHHANERCDEIATMFADNENPSLYSGSKAKYLIDHV